MVKKLLKGKKLLIGLVMMGAVLISTYFILRENGYMPPKYICIVDSDCVAAGCSGQLCVHKDDSNKITTCEWQPEYQCYQHSNCVCSFGSCQWKRTPAFVECMGTFS